MSTEIRPTECGRNVSWKIDSFNLDAIMAVGYRINSYQATQSRIWATNTLKESLLKGIQGRGKSGREKE